MNTRFTQRQPQGVLGIDVQSSGIHLVELSRESRCGLRLRHCAWAPCEPGWVVQGHILAFEEVCGRLRDLVRSSSATARCGVLGMPSRSVTTFRLPVPVSADEDAVAQAVETSVADRLGVRPQDWVVDYCEAQQSCEQSQHPRREVMVALSRRDRIRDRLGLAESAGLEVLAIDLETQACEAAWATLHAESTTARAARVVLLHLDEEGIQAMGRVGGVVCAESSLSWASEQSNPLAPLSHEAKVHLVWQWLRSGQHWTKPQSDEQLPDIPAWDVIYLAGRLSPCEPWAQQLTAVSGVPVEVLNPMASAAAATSNGSLDALSEGPAYFKAFGLAVQGTWQ